MKTNELRKKSASELEKFLEEANETLRTLRFKHVGGELKNVREIGKTKRAIAKTFTLLKEAKQGVPANAQAKSSGKSNVKVKSQNAKGKTTSKR